MLSTQTPVSREGALRDVVSRQIVPAGRDLTVREPQPREPLGARPRTSDSVPVDPAVWRSIIDIVRTQHPGLHRVWFDQMAARMLPNGVIQVEVASGAQLNFCQNQCQQPFIAAAQQATGRLVAVGFYCEPALHGGVFNAGDAPLPLNPDYVFENFVSGPCNRLPHAACVAVAEQPGKRYNPLFIHGDVGLGKSHLLQAVCQSVLERDPGKRILYLSCDSFINQFITAIENGDMNTFRFRYRHVDILVIDDIHFLAGRDRTQEEFFHTFNTLYQLHKQIILSADCPPSEIPELEERLVSRFNWGLVARIEKPCFEMRVAILQKKARLRGMTLPDDVVCYVAAKVENNTRELEGAITKIQGMAMLQATQPHTGATNGLEPVVIDLELARAALGESAAAGQKLITIQQILDAVTKYYSVRVSDLQSKKRHKSIAFPRQVCMYLARRVTRYSLEEIGGYFGGRDHTTVMHAVRTITEQIASNADVGGQITQLEGKIGAV